MNVRNIERHDLGGCAELYAEVFASSPWHEPWTSGAALSRLTHFYESKGFVGVLVEDADLTGFALGNTEPFHTGNIFYLREMCMARHYQSQGLGRRVYAALENELRLQSVKSIYLATDRGIPAENFYLNNGFQYVEVMGFYVKRIC